MSGEFLRNCKSEMEGSVCLAKYSLEKESVWV